MHHFKYIRQTNINITAMHQIYKNVQRQFITKLSTNRNITETNAINKKTNSYNISAAKYSIHLHNAIYTYTIMRSSASSEKADKYTSHYRMKSFGRGSLRSADKSKNHGRCRSCDILTRFSRSACENGLLAW